MTEIVPGMMVECIVNTSVAGAIKGNKYFVLAIDAKRGCNRGHSECCGLFLSGIPNPCEVLPAYKGYPEFGWAECCFRPIGGDKEIEREESQRTGKSADGDARNGTDHPFKFYIFDMDDK